MADDLTWVSLSEASTKAGVSISWLRKQYREHGLPTRDTVGRRGLQKSVPLEEVVARAAVFTSLPPPVEAAPPAAVTEDQHGGGRAVAVTLADLTTLVERLVRDEHQCPLLDRLIEVEARAARAEAEAAYLLLKLDDAYLEIEQLRRELSEIPRP